MKTILSDSFTKIAIVNLDDEPGKANRFPGSGAFDGNINRGTEGDDEILDRWTDEYKKKKKKQRENAPKEHIYQLGITVEEDPVSQAEEERQYS